MASTQEIHHLPVQGEDFNIQDGQDLEAPQLKKHKCHKKCVTCDPAWKCKSLKKYIIREKKHKCCNHTLESDSELRSSNLYSNSESDSCLETHEIGPTYRYKPLKECSLPVKCFEFKHKLNKGVVPGEEGDFVLGNCKSHKLFCKDIECTEGLQCKFEHNKCLTCAGNVQNCFVSNCQPGQSSVCSHCEGNGHQCLDCEDIFRRCLSCREEFRNLSCECFEHSRLCLCALRLFLIKKCALFGCHKSKPWPKPWSKQNSMPVTTNN